MFTYENVREDESFAPENTKPKNYLSYSLVTRVKF